MAEVTNKKVHLKIQKNVHFLLTCMREKKRSRRWKSLDVSLHCGFIQKKERLTDSERKSSHIIKYLLYWLNFCKKFDIYTYRSNEVILKIIRNNVKDCMIRNHQMSHCKLKAPWNMQIKQITNYEKYLLFMKEIFFIK